MSAEGSAHEASRLSRLPSGGESALFRAGTDVFHVFPAPALPCRLALRCALVCRAVKRRRGGAAHRPVARAVGTARHAGEPCLQPRGRDHSGLSPLGQPSDAGVHRLRLCRRGDARRRGAVVFLLEHGDDLGQAHAPFRARRARPLAPAVHDAALCAPLSGKAPGGDGGAAGHGTVRGKGPASKAQERRDGLFRYGDMEP